MLSAVFVVLMAASVVFAVRAVFAFRAFQSHPAVSRGQGRVTLVTPISDGGGAMVCLTHASKAKIAELPYGRVPAYDGDVCMNGDPQPTALPAVGDCVALQTERKTGAMKIMSSSNCV
jgi:hypothetical protein